MLIYHSLDSSHSSAWLQNTGDIPQAAAELPLEL